MKRTLLSSEDLAEMIGKPVTTLVQWRYRGTGPAYFKLGGTVRYDLADIEAWLDASRVETSR